MKFFLQILLFFLLITQIHYPQWTYQNPVPDGNDLCSTFFMDDSTGWIVGSAGFIKKTTNAGIDWIQQNSGTNSTLRSVQFVDQNNGWICGEAGLILKTTDGGVNWDSIASGTIQLLTDIHYCTPDTGYAVGYGGTILKSTNGGSTWTTLISGTTNILFSVDFVSAATGWAVGGLSGSNPPTIIKTTDGGINWTPQSVGTNSVLYSVDFVDEYNGFAVGRGPVIKTTDGGNSWSQSSDLPFNVKERKLNLYDRHSSPYPYPGYYSIFFIDANNGCRVGSPNGLDSYIYETSDAGITWVQKYRAWDQPAFLSVFVTPNGKGWTVGLHGLIGTKEENDSDWSLVLSGHGDRVYSIYFINENIGWAGVYRFFGQSPGQKVVLKTTNGGKVWKSQLDNFDDTPMRCVYFINELIGWAVSSSQSYSGDNYQALIGGGIYRTTDGGENWSFTNIDGTFVFFLNQDTGWVTYKNTYNGGINKSTDGGITWVQKSTISSSSVFFLDINAGWATSTEGILKSTDGGETWINKSSSSGSYIRFFDSNVGMCVGGEILVSTDGGETWSSKSGPSLQSINFINSTTIWGSSSNGTVYKTFDFGDTWITLNVGLGFEGKVFFINEYTGWVGGGTNWIDEGKNIWKYSVEPPIPPIWLNQITVEDAGGTESSQVLTIGQHTDATDSIDSSLGEYELPPPPPTGIFDARFNLPTNPPVSSLIDYRDSAKTEIIWTMTFQPGSSGYPMTFSWDSTSFPEGTFYLKDRINGSFVNANMKNKSSYILTNADITSLSIIHRGVSSIVDVKNEWNMISVPLLAEDMSLSNLFPTATSLAYGFEGSYLTEDTLVGGKGYWLKFDGNQQVRIYGSRMGDTVPLETGWNMFGVYENDIPVTQLTTTPPGIIATYFFEYNDGYYIADTLKSGQGFWVRVTSDGTLNLNSVSLMKDGEQLQFAEMDKNWGKIKITDSKGKSITLFATEDEIESNFYELPPMPPTGIFDARYSSGRLAENLSSEQIIQISSDSYPITIRAEGLNIAVRDIINGELLNEELKNGEEIRITNNKITSIEVTGRVTEGLPISYELYQNYPNPFNPTTTIKFAISRESQVDLSIYNALGELVTTLVNEQLKAGYYEYEFDASQFSSGVYLYRIKAGDFIETNKMILIK